LRCSGAWTRLPVCSMQFRSKIRIACIDVRPAGGLLLGCSSSSTATAGRRSTSRSHRPSRRDLPSPVCAGRHLR
jgi:hypothetical protein